MIGTYEYDLWGNPISITESTPGIDVDNILEKNPIRYRGYHYDEETGFYHLQSRYYDPVIRRFISADTVASIFVNIISPYGKNLFTYCENSPICYEDGTGQYYETPYDLITLEMSLCELAEDDTSLGAWINVILDVADVILPFATFPVGAGELCRMVRTTKRANTMIFAHTTLKYADEAVAVGNMVAKRTDDVMDAGRHGSKLVGDAIEGGSDVIGTVTKTNPFKLKPTHSQTLSKNKMNALIEDIKINGIQEPIKYVEYNGQMYVVDGHHRLLVAKKLGLTEIPIEKVDLPYAGYSTIEDLLWFD